MNATIYHNPRCSKSRQTLALLQERGIKPHVIEYLKNPPSAANLKKLLQMLKMTPHQLVRKKDAKALGINPAALDEKNLLARITRHPILMERPVVVCGTKAALGRPPQNVLEILGLD